MPARVDRRADPFAATGRGDIGKPLPCCRAHLLELVEYVCARLFQEWSSLLPHFDRVGEFDGAGDVRHVTNDFKRRAVAASSLEVEAERFCQLQLRYSQVVLGSNELRNLIAELHLRLQHVEPRNCSCFKSVLLVLQLSSQKIYVFLVHLHEVAIDDDLVKLRLHRRDQLIQNIAEGEIGAVALKESAPDLIESCAVKNELRPGNTDRVGDIALFNILDRGWRRRRRGLRPNVPDLRRQSFHQGCGGRGGRRSRRRTRVTEYARASQVWIDPLEIRIRIDLRQRLCAHLNNHALASFDLLLCVEKSRVTLQRCQNGLVQSKGRQSASGHCFAAVCSLAAAKTRLTKNPERCDYPQVKKEPCHTALPIRRTKAGEWIQRSLIAFPSAKAKSFRLTIVVNFAVNVKPRRLLVRCEVIQYFHDVTNHFLTNSADESRAFRRDADHHLAAVISCGRAHHIPKIFETRHETAGRSRSVTHFLRDLGHAEHFLAVEIREKKKLRERNVARREFLRQVQQKAALHFQNDVGKPFGIPTSVIRRSLCKRGNLSRVQGDKARNGHVTCQSCSAGLECGDVSPLSKRRHVCALQMQRDLIQ